MIDQIKEHAERLGIKTKGKKDLDLVTEFLDLVEDLFREGGPKWREIFQDTIRLHNSARAFEGELIKKEGIGS